MSRHDLSSCSSTRLLIRLHYLNLAVCVVATAHGLGAGTDAASGWLLALYAITTTGLAVLAARRFSRARAPVSRPRRPGFEGGEA